MWVRPGYYRDLVRDRDSRRLINLDHFKSVRVIAVTPDMQTPYWAIEAIGQTRAEDELLAALRTEEEARDAFTQLSDGLGVGKGFLDLSQLVPTDQRG
jgi:hypothetical protein